MDDPHGRALAVDLPRLTRLRSALIVGFLVVGVAFHVVALGYAASRDLLAPDLVRSYVPAARAILDGRSPYPLSDDEVGNGLAYVYPPHTAFASIPFTAVPWPEALGALLAVACLLLSLQLLGVRDWRCYLAAFLWSPVFHAVQTVNVTMLLVLGAALCWRFRDHVAGASVAAGLSVAAKPIVWPLALWLGATRRWPAVGGALGVGVGSTAALWAILGFSGLVRYPGFVERMADSAREDSYTVVALLADAGVTGRPAALAGALVAVVAVAGVLYFGRRDEARSFACAMVVVVTATPVVWHHYLAFLLVAVAVLQPRLSVAWVLPVAGWVYTGNGNGETLDTALTLGACLLAFALALRSPAPQPVAARATTAMVSSR